jgi:hypothetical protein
VSGGIPPPAYGRVHISGAQEPLGALLTVHGKVELGCRHHWQPLGQRMFDGPLSKDHNLVVDRRQMLQLGLGLASSLAFARTSVADSPPSPDLRVLDLRLDGDPRIARRALVWVPSYLPTEARVPLLVLLHGLGETGNEQLGIHAWGERYGLVKAYERLRRPPFSRTLQHQRYLTDERCSEINRSLGVYPFRGMVVACPVTPNPWRLEGASTLDRYADWVTSTLLPAVRERAPVLEGRACVGLDGCSLGGYVALEVYLRKPRAFGTLGTVQAAISVAGASTYARKLADAIAGAGPCPIHVETSSGDSYRDASQELAQRLTALGLLNELRVIPGPHDQPWLREIGTAEVLLWHDRALRATPPPVVRENARRLVW